MDNLAEIRDSMKVECGTCGGIGYTTINHLGGDTPCPDCKFPCKACNETGLHYDPTLIISVLSELANGKVCERCGGNSACIMVRDHVEGVEKCKLCNGTGHTAPHLRTLDALIAEAMGEEVAYCKSRYVQNDEWSRWVEDDFVIMTDVDARYGTLVPHYTTDWGAGGAELLSVIKVGLPWLISYNVGSQFNTYFYLIEFEIVNINKNETRFVEYTGPNTEIEIQHTSELVARGMAWLAYMYLTEGKG